MTPRSCVPELLDSLRDAHIVGLERVERNTESDGREPQRPHGDAAEKGHTVLGEVIDDA